MPPYAVVAQNPAVMGSLQVEVPGVTTSSAPHMVPQPALPFQTYQLNGVTYFPPPSSMQFVPVQHVSGVPPMQCVPMQGHNHSPVPMPMDSTVTSDAIPIPVVSSISPGGLQTPTLSVSPVSQHSPGPVDPGYQFAPIYHQHTPPQMMYMATSPTMMFSPSQVNHVGHFAPGTPPQFSSLVGGDISTPGGSPGPRNVSTPSSVSSHSHSGDSGTEKSLSTRLEVVWHGEFERLFKTYPHKWELHPLGDPRALQETELHKFMDSAKVRFICPHCSNCWTSMKGRVYFMYILDPVDRRGCVYFTLIGQKCSKCPDKEFVHAMWYPDEIQKVISNVHQKVGQSYYGLTQPVVRLDRRKGQPKKPHMLQSCQACALGICREEHNFR